MTEMSADKITLRSGTRNPGVLSQARGKGREYVAFI
jgi:hypothetical protein